ncbi:MAG TPA: hypothetical protein VG275_07130 [Solirubrobacteraceae bacterium]|jgi:hypothetical protein|nr:hypothetical protein [Solirubrobacteraceae bacterium]
MGLDELLAELEAQVVRARHHAVAMTAALKESADWSRVEDRIWVEHAYHEAMSHCVQAENRLKQGQDIVAKARGAS